MSEGKVTVIPRDEEAIEKEREGWRFRRKLTNYAAYVRGSEYANKKRSGPVSASGRWQ